MLDREFFRMARGFRRKRAEDPAETTKWRKKDKRRRLDIKTTKHEKAEIVLAYMNISRASEENVSGIQEWLKKNPEVDLLLIGETQRRQDMCTEQLEFSGYDWAVQERSGNQKGGGGLLSIWRDNIRVKVWLSAHTGKDDRYKNERMWTILDKGAKLAVCNVYLATESRENNDYKEWNRELLAKIELEVGELREQGLEVVLMGDFNSHVGRTGGALMRNREKINNNGEMLNFWIQSNDLWIGNEVMEDEDIMTRRWYTPQGKLWSESLLDLGLLSDSIERSRVKMTVKREVDSLIDSDHSMIELRLQVHYKNEFYRMPVKPSLYKVGEGADYEAYEKETGKRADLIMNQGYETLSIGGKAKKINKIMLEAAKMKLKKKPRSKGKQRSLELRDKIGMKRKLWREIKGKEEIDEKLLKTYTKLKQEISNIKWEETKVVVY